MNMQSFLFAAVLSFLAASSCPAQDSEALALLVSHSDAVVIATYAPSEGLIMRSGGASYVGEDFKDVVTLSGEKAPQTLLVKFVRWGGDEARPFKPGQRFILFLKYCHTTVSWWELSDMLFGCQPYTHGLELSVSEAAKSR